MWGWLQRLGSPKASYRMTCLLQPYVGALTLLLLSVGLFTGLAMAPADYQQGDAYRIIYVHVPAAIIAMLTYAVMAVAAFVFLVWKIKVADMVAKVSPAVGVVFTLMTLVAGCFWGKPMWGAWWIWDARLTAELVQLIIYLGIMAVRSAIPEATIAAKISAVMILVGAINLPIIHYSVYWWHTLHQGATMLRFGKPLIAGSMLFPLILMLLGSICLYLWLMCMRLRTELIVREGHKQWLKVILQG